MKFHFLSLLALLLLAGCKKDEDPVVPESSTPASTHEGLWSLVSFEGGFVPVTTFDDQIYWSITEDQILVLISEGTTVPANLPLGNNGAYDYSMPSSGTITLNGVTHNLTVTDNSLVIEDNLAADGTRLTFAPAEP
ncbi:MAG: hypothetical protein ACK5XQ_04085 [Flavobacteriales bacterium]|jgi:hypothetical protein